MTTTVTTKVAFIKAFSAIFAFKVTPSGSVCNLDDTSAVEFLTDLHENLSATMVDAAKKSKVLMGLVSLVEKLGAPDEKMEQIAKTVSDFRDDMHIHRQAERDTEELVLLAAKWEREQAATESLAEQNDAGNPFTSMPPAFQDLMRMLSNGRLPEKKTATTEAANDVLQAANDGEPCPGCGQIHELPEGFMEFMAANGFVEADPDMEIQNGQEISLDKLPPELQEVFGQLQKEMGSKMKIMVGQIK